MSSYAEQLALLLKAHQATPPHPGLIFDEQKHRWIRPEEPLNWAKTPKDVAWDIRAAIEEYNKYPESKYVTNNLDQILKKFNISFEELQDAYGGASTQEEEIEAIKQLLVSQYKEGKKAGKLPKSITVMGTEYNVQQIIDNYNKYLGSGTFKSFPSNWEKVFNELKKDDELHKWMAGNYNGPVLSLDQAIEQGMVPSREYFIQALQKVGQNGEKQDKVEEVFSVEDKPPEKESSKSIWDNLEKIGGQLGSQPGAKYKNKLTGQEYYIKTPKTEEHARVEMLANDLYKLAGVGVPNQMLISDVNENDSIMSDWIDGKLADMKDDAIKAALQEDFVMDAWLANWDVIGLENDNIVEDAFGYPHRIDAGGALYFRAQGGKEKKFDGKVIELKTMRDPKVNPQAAAVFGSMTDEDVKNSATVLQHITDKHIDDLVKDFGVEKYPDGKNLAETLKKRRDSILEQVGLKDKPKPPCKPGFHKHDKFEKCHPVNQKHRDDPQYALQSHIGKILSTHKNRKIRTIYKAAMEEVSEEWGKEDFLNFAGRFDIVSPTKKVYGAMQKWQTGSITGQVQIRAMIATLRGDEAQQYPIENAYYIYQKGLRPSEFNDAFNAGKDSAIGLIPFIASTQKHLEKKYGKAIPAIYRGVSAKMAENIRQAVDNSGEDDLIAIPNDGSSAGFSLDIKQARRFTDGDNMCILRKENFPVSSVWLYFHPLTDQYSEERELVVDSSSSLLFKPSEIATSGDTYHKWFDERNND